jgi:hypothetical protein
MEPGMLLNIPQCTEQPPPAYNIKNYLIQILRETEIENPCFKPKSPGAVANAHRNKLWIAQCTKWE